MREQERLVCDNLTNGRPHRVNVFINAQYCDGIGGNPYPWLCLPVTELEWVGASIHNVHHVGIFHRATVKD